MQRSATKSVLAIGLVLGCCTSTAFAQAAGGTTLWHFLGIPQGLRYVRDNTLNRSGNRPALERKPPLKPIGDPKNLESPDPSIKKAAEVKQAEDLKKQKIKAIKYLAQIGCGCYNRDGSITDALIKSMDDCTEEVRLATVQAISEAAAGERCANCKTRSCCSEEISNKLYEIAYERDENGCFLEPSERVRMAAAEALRTCCEGRDDMMFMEPGPTPAPQTGGEQPAAAPEVGGERPGAAPPVLIDPAPPAAPLQNPPRSAPVAPPAPIVPPRATSAAPPAPTIPSHTTSAAPPVLIVSPRTTSAPIISPRTAPPASASAAPAPATAALDNSQTSRRTAMLKAQPVRNEQPAESYIVVKPPLPPIAVPAYDAPAPTQSTTPIRIIPHWTPAGQQTVSFRDTASGPIPLDEAVVHPTPDNVIVASLPDRNQSLAAEPGEIDATLGLAPIVSPDDVKRPRAQAQLIPSSLPPSGGAPIVLPASVQKPSQNKTTATEATHQTTPPVMTSDVSLNHPAKPSRPKPVMPRKLPGAEFGTGTVTSVRLKDGRAVIEFNTSANLPTGSLLRVYHQYALIAKKAVGDLQVIESENGKTVAVAHGKSQLSDLAVGDRAVVLQ